MKRYVFSNGRLAVEDSINLAPQKRHHPLRSSPVWIRIPAAVWDALDALQQAEQEDGPDGRQETEVQRQR
jgi:hypothetical protein